MSEPELHLHASCLASKWGFSDGDILFDFLYDLVDAGLLAQNAKIEDVAEDVVLRQLVHERLLPVIPLAVEVYNIETIHNPIRASVVEGNEVDDTALDQPAERLLEPYSVTVPWRDVVRLAGLEVVPGEVVAPSGRAVRP